MYATQKNEVVVINRFGMATYGKLSEKTMNLLGMPGLKELHSRLDKRHHSVEEMRALASQKVQEMGGDPVIWPIPDEDIKAIENGDPVPGLLLTDILMQN